MLGLPLNAGDPVARWVGDDWSGGTANWVDRVGGKIATSYGSPVKATTQFGGSASSSGIVFDGVDDYFQVTAANNPIAGQKKVTIVALFKATQGATGTDGNHWNYPGPINAESGGSPNDFGLTIGTDGLAHAFFNGAISTPSSISVVDGLVHTMMLTWADPDVGDGTARFYVDGVLKGSLVTDGGSGIVADLIRFGRERETSTRWFRGTVGELRFYASIEDPAALHASMSNVVPTLGFISTTDATGGELVRISDSNIHTFRQSGSFVPSTSGTVEVLVVGGGGGGGSGGGGAGGVVYQSSFSVTAGQPLVVTIGAGGTGGALNGTVLAGVDGGSSSFGSLVGFGGGGGGAFRGAGRSGASSGGTGGDTSAASGAATQGFRGADGAANDGYVAGGGGGGAGGVGTRGLWGADGYGYATASSPGGNGGSGVNHSISGTAKYYGGGGGGGANNNTGSPTVSGGDGGFGGGGVGARSNWGQGAAGSQNTGGGGGGGDPEGLGGAGGSGVVIVRYSATTTQSTRTLSVTGSATQTSFSAISGSVKGTDPDSGTTLVYGIQGGAATGTANQVAKTGSYGTLTLNTATGAYSFTPSAAGINPLQASASEVYTLTVSDGVSSASVALTVQINVSYPTLAAIGVSGTEDIPLTFSFGNFSSSFFDPEGASLASIQIVTPPATGVLSLGGSAVSAAQVIPFSQLGSLTYTPAANENGAKTFTVTASDGSAWSGVATVTMTLAPVNDAPVAGSASFTAIAEDVAVADNAGTAVSVFANAGSDGDIGALKGIAITSVDSSNGSWQYTIDGGVNWSSLSGVSSASARLFKSDELHRVRFLPTPHYNGTATLQYRAWDQVIGADGTLLDLTATGGGAWALVAYGANASLGGFLNSASGTFSSAVRSGSAVLPALSLLKSSSELAMSWTVAGGGFPVGGITSYSHAIAFPLPQASAMSFDGTATSPPKYFESQYNAAISFAVGSTHPDQSLVTVRTLAGSPGMPEQMYLRNKSFGVGYGGVYGLVMNDGSNPQLDYGQFPDGQTFKAVYLDHGTGDAQQSGLVMGGAGGVQNSYVPSTMALWVWLTEAQIQGLAGVPVTVSGNRSLAGIGTTYLDVAPGSLYASFSANSATVTMTVTPVNDAPVLTVSGSSSTVLNASTLKASTGATADGVYSLFFNGVSTPVYCLMNDALAGGGWMLAMKGANSGDAFNYSSAHWTTATILNTTANRRNDAYNEDAKFEVFNSMPASEILVVFPEAAAGGAIPNQTYGFIWKESMPTPANTADYSGRPTQSDYTGKTLRELFAGGEEIFIRDAVSTTPYRAAGSGVFSTQTDVRFFGFNYVSTVGNNRVRFGFGWNENGGGLYPGGNEQSNDVSGGLGLDRVNWSAGDYIGCCQNSTGLNRSLKFEVYVRGPVSSSMLTEDVAGNVLFQSPLVQDVDGNSLTVTLSALDGVITGNQGDGVLVGGTTTARTFAGLAVNLNAYFATAGKVTYLGAANNSTDRTLTVSVSDGSATATGSRLLSFIPVNDVPSLGTIAKSGSEDAVVTFAATDFSAVYSDPESSPLASITVLTLPSTGSLKLSGVVVTAGQVIASADLANLAYTPAANENGPKTFTVNASDGIAGSEPATVTMTLAPVNDAPYFTQSSITYDAFDDFVTGPTLQSTGNRWQYFGGSVSGLNLLANWKTGGNEVIPSIPQWDGSSGHLNNYPFVQRIQSAVGPVAAGTLVMHPSNLGASDRAVAVGWKNNSTQTVAVGFKVSLRLPYGSANGIDYWLQRGLLGAPRYWVIRSGYLGGGGSATLSSDETVELQAGEMLYLIVDSKDNFEYDHTEVSNFEVTVNPTNGANGGLGTIIEDVANTDNLGTVVSAMTAGISDADSGALKGIAVSAVDSSNGSWQSTTDGGLTWLSLSDVSAFSARLLKGNEADHRIRFIPHANYNGPATITYHAWDQTSSAHGNVQGHSDGLLAWLGFENNLNDLAEGRTHGGSLSIQPDGFFAAAVPAGVGAGEYSGVFNGTSTRVDLANSASLNVNTGVPFSMAAWIRTSFNDSGQRVILAKALSGATHQNHTAALFVDAGGRLRFDNFWINALSSSAQVRTGEWVHVTVTYDGATYRLYVGGQPDGVAAFAGSNDSQGTWTFSIGQSMNTEFPGASFQGNIDEVGFWNRALGSSEVAALATGGIGVGTTAFSSDPATATITVTPVNDIPVATVQTVTTDEDTAKAITLAGTDVEGSTLIYTVVTQPTKGILTGTVPNLTYTPKLNVNGSDSFTFKVNDGTVDSGVATVSITITAVNDAPTLALGGGSAVGGTQTSAGGYTIHTFTADGTFTPTFSGTVEVLVVGGGGGGGSDNGGGGGGGGYVAGSSVSVSAETPITVKVGAGGQGAPNASSTASNGGDSSFGTLTARGGGGGGSIDLTAGADGGSAGGRAANRWGGAENATVTTSPEQGFAGGAKNPGGFGGGGGGGAGGSGSNGGSNIGGNGGAGRSSDISGMVTHYAGGGGGGGDSNTAGTGGIGGGGNGSRRGDEVPTQGADGRGGGGGAAGGSVAGGLGARGGSGIVVVRYSLAALNGLAGLKYVDGAAADTFTVGSGTFAGTDVDTGTTLTYGITGGILESGVVTKTGTYGTLRVTPATGAYSFTPNEAAINALSSSTSETFVVTVSDGTATTPSNWVVNLTGVNDAPTVTAPASFTLTEDVAGNLLYLGTPFADVDSASLTVTLSVTDGTITGSAVTGITVGGTATARTFAGTVAALNTYFTTAGNITYQGPLNNTTSRTLTTAVVEGAFEAYPLTSLQARYDASNSGSLTKVGAEVSQWADLSGNGFHLSAIENGRPSLGQVNELPAMNFNPGKGFFRAGVPLNTEVTVLMAIRYSSAIGNWGNFMHHGQHDDDWSMRKSDWSNPVGKIGFHTNNDNQRVMNSLVNDMTYVLVGRLRTSTGNSLVDYWAYPKTGDEFVVLNADLGPKSITGGSKTLYVGTSDVAEASNGMIGEILYYNTALSDSALSVAAGYLRNKWLGNAPTATGGDVSLAVSTTSTIFLTPVNDAPVNTVPGVQVVAEDALLNFTDAATMTVGDIDSDQLEVELSVLQGVLKVVLPEAGVTLSGGALGSSGLKLSGAWTALNQVLTTLNYQGAPNYFGPDTLTIRTTDSGGLSDTDTVGINVTPVNDPPVIGAVEPAIIRLVGVDWALPANLPRRVALPISDIDSVVDGSLGVTVSSGDTAVVPTSAIRAVYQGGWFLEVSSVVPDTDGTATVPVTVTVTDAAGGSTSRAVDVVIQAPPRIVSPLVGGDFRVGGTLQFTIEATGTAPFTYVWYHNSVRVEGADGPMLNVSPAGSERSGRYSVVVSNDLGQHESGLATVVMVDPPKFLSPPINIWALEGSPAELKADVIGGEPLIYEWFREGQWVFTGKVWNRASVNASDAGAYELRVRNSVATLRSGPVFVTVQRPRVEVQGWGDNSFRQLVFDSSWTNLVSLSAGERFTVGLRADGSVVVNGALGQPPVFGARVVDVAAGGEHAVALLENGTIRAWGTTTPAVTAAESRSGGVFQVVAGADYTAWLDADGRLQIAGGSASGITVPSESLIQYRSLAAGPTTLLGRLRSTGVWSSVGGKGRAVPVVQGALVGLSQVALGLAHGLGVSGGGANLVAWGDGGFEQTIIPTASLPSAMTAVSAGHYHSVVLGSANQVVAWGAGSSDTATAWPHFKQSRVPDNLKAAQVAAGGFHTVVLAHRAPEFSTGLAAQSVQLGQAASLTVVVDGVTPITYQWIKGGTALANQTGATLTIASTAVADGGTYRVTATTPYGSISSEASLTVIEPPTVTTTATTQTLNAGTTATFAVSPTGTGPFTYQWLLNDEPIDGATSETLALSGIGAGQAGVYKVQVSGLGGKVTSTVTTVSVLSLPVFTVQPLSVVAISGQTASLKATATGGGTVMLQWQKKSGIDQSVTWAAINGATTGQRDFSNVQTSDAGTYRVVASNAAGSVNSAEVTLTVVNPAAPGTPEDITVATLNAAREATTVTLAANLVVDGVTLPRTLSGVVATVYRLSVQFTGTEPVQLQWLRDGVNLVGATTSVLELPALDAGGKQDGLYQVRLMNAAGPGAAATGAGVRLTTAGAPRLLVAPLKEVLGQIGGTVSLPLEVAGTVSTVVWRKNGVALSVATGSRWSVSGSSLTITGLLDEDVGRYEATLNNSLGSLVTPEIVVRLTGTPPGISTQPVSAVKLLGTSLSLSVTANGPVGVPLTYQWMLDGKAIAGATSSDYGVTSIGLKDVGDYTVLVTARGNGSVSSVPATVRLVEAPVITQQPVDVNALVGTAVTLKVVVKGDASSAYPTTYRWYNRNGPIPLSPATGSLTVGGDGRANGPTPAAPVSGQATDTLVVTHTEVPPDGVVQYYCVVENAAGKVTSKPVLLVVLKALSELAVSGDTNAIQTFNLKPGWNAIYLTVQPANSAIDTVFAGIPWSSVWRFKNKRDPVQFIQDMSEAQWDSAKWLVRWRDRLPSGETNPYAFDNTLTKVARHQAYLVHISGTNGQTLRVLGGRGHLPTRWVTDNYNLTGYPVGSAPQVAAQVPEVNAQPAAPTGVSQPSDGLLATLRVRDFLSWHSELWDGAQSAPRGMYRLTADGIWAPMVAGDEVKYGEAYWVYAKGAPKTSGSFGLELDYGESLDFPDDNDSRTIKLLNPKSTSMKVRIQLQAAGTVSLSATVAAPNDPNFGDPNKATVTQPPTGQATSGSQGVNNVLPIEVMTPTVAGMVPINLALSGVVELAAGEERTLVLKANRSSVGATGWRNLLLLDDGISTYQVPASIKRSATLLTGKSVTKRRGASAKPKTAPAAPGLWLGRVSIGGVSPVNGYDTQKTTKSFVNDDGVATNVVEIAYVAKATMAEATPVSRPLEFNVLIHVDNQGASKILQEVYLMQVPQSANGTPGSFVLISDRRNLSNFQGTAMKGRERSGRRLSSMVLGLNGAARTNGYLAMSGQFKPGNAVTVTVGMDSQSPLNPFYHKYHPDHDNLTADFKVYQEEAYGFSRDIIVALSADQDGAGSKDGSEVMKGTYTEVIRGLHRLPIQVTGQVEMVRVSTLGVINPTTW